LRCLNAKKLWSGMGWPHEVRAILQKYMGQGKRAMFDCQKELEDAGFEGNARW
jgi:hypothetical protein